MKPILACSCLLVATLAGCKDDAPKPDTTGTSRSEVVKATGTQQTAAPSTPAKHAPPPPSAPRKLCDKEPAAAGTKLPTAKLEHLEAAGSPALGDRIPTGGRWTWVNFWAAWCGPCKEEIPRLKQFEQKLAQGGTPITLAFVSLDDDQRQAQKFLDSQPNAGLRSTWWLPEGKRGAWTSDLKMKSDPSLPVQLLFDPSGALRCIIDGAVEDGDLPQIQAIVSRR